MYIMSNDAAFAILSATIVVASQSCWHGAINPETDPSTEISKLAGR